MIIIAKVSTKFKSNQFTIILIQARVHFPVTTRNPQLDGEISVEAGTIRMCGR